MKYLVLILFLFSCNPAKKVMKDKEAFDKIGRAWLKDNPCVNDSIEIIKTVEGIPDTIYQPYRVIDSASTQRLKDSLATASRMECTREINDAFDVGYAQAKSQCKPTIIRRVDTVRKEVAVRDRQYEGLMQKDKDTLIEKNTALDKEKSEWKGKARARLWMAISLLLLCILLLFLLIKKGGSNNNKTG